MCIDWVSALLIARLTLVSVTSQVQLLKGQALSIVTTPAKGEGKAACLPLLVRKKQR